MVEQGYEFVVLVEGAGSLIQSLDYHANRRHFSRVSPAPMQRIH